MLTAESAGDLRNKAGDLEFSGADEDGGSEGPGEQATGCVLRGGQGRDRQAGRACAA